MRDLFHNTKATPVINPGAAITGNGATNGAIIDTQGYESLTFAIQSGVITDGGFTPSLQEGEAANLSDASAVAASDMLGTVAGATFAATDDNVVKTLGYKGSHRYVRLVLTQAGATSGGIMGAAALQSHARNNPSNSSPAPTP